MFSRYFGRAKDLPGVKELFESRKVEEEEENAVTAFYRKFLDPGRAYFGDMDETDGQLLEYEREKEEEGAYLFTKSRFGAEMHGIAWEEAHSNLRAVLKSKEPTPKYPRPEPSHVPSTNIQPNGADADVDMSAPSTTELATANVDHAKAAAAYIPFLKPEDLMQPTLLSREEMEDVLLGLRKQALVDEYF